MSDLEQRYGRPSRGARLTALVLIVALVVSGAGLLTWFVWDRTNPEVTSQISTYEIIDEHSAVATITVLRSSSTIQATCVVNAIAEDHAVVGIVEVPVTDGPEKQTLEVEVRTERRPTTVDLAGCTSPGQKRPG